MKEKSTIATTYRGDIRKIATLAKFWNKNGQNLNSINNLLNTTISAFHELILKKYPEFEIIKIHDAIKTLESLKIYNLQGKNRNIKTLIEELSLESLKDTSQEVIVQKSESPFGSDLAKKRIEQELENQLQG